MSPTRKESVEACARSECKACLKCGRGRWFHLQSRGQRRAEDWRDDGHMFQFERVKQGSRQLNFEFEGAIQVPAVELKKKPPARLAKTHQPAKRKSA